MKPLNFDNSPCSPTSSNCVIWGGPDLACINVCKGDSITDVVAKLATELCTLLDTFNISAYDISCFNLVNCAPQTFTDLINFLIVKICELENATPPDGGGGTNPSTGCPTDCIVDVAPCFVVGTATTMTLTEYAIAIGEKVCAIINTNALQQAAIDDLEIRVQDLEAAPAPIIPVLEVTLSQTLPSIPSLSGTQPVETVVQSYINQIWFPFVATTGDSGLLANAVSIQTVAGTDVSKAIPSSTMSAVYSGIWASQIPNATIAGTINNIWACIEDLRNQPPVTVAALATPTITMNVTGGPAYVVSADIIPQAPSIADTATVNLSVGVGPTYTLTADVIVPGAMFASGTPSNLTNITPTIATTLVSGTTQIMSEIYDEDNAYDPLTGIWTCPATGVYNLSFFIQLQETSLGFSSGSVVAGITNLAVSSIYAASTVAIGNITPYVYLNGCMLGSTLTAGTQLCLKIINFTNVPYTSTSGDAARMTIQKVK